MHKKHAKDFAMSWFRFVDKFERLHAMAQEIWEGNKAALFTNDVAWKHKVDVLIASEVHINK